MGAVSSTVDSNLWGVVCRSPWSPIEPVVVDPLEVLTEPVVGCEFDDTLSDGGQPTKVTTNASTASAFRRQASQAIATTGAQIALSLAEERERAEHAGRTGATPAYRLRDAGESGHLERDRQRVSEVRRRRVDPVPRRQRDRTECHRDRTRTRGAAERDEHDDPEGAEGEKADELSGHEVLTRDGTHRRVDQRLERHVARAAVDAVLEERGIQDAIADILRGPPTPLTSSTLYQLLTCTRPPDRGRNVGQDRSRCRDRRGNGGAVPPLSPSAARSSDASRQHILTLTARASGASTMRRCAMYCRAGMARGCVVGLIVIVVLAAAATGTAVAAPYGGQRGGPLGTPARIRARRRLERLRRADRDRGVRIPARVLTIPCIPLPSSAAR